MFHVQSSIELLYAINHLSIEISCTLPRSRDEWLCLRVYHITDLQ